MATTKSRAQNTRSTLWALVLQSLLSISNHLVDASPVHTRDLEPAENVTAAAIIYGYPLFPYVELVYPLLESTGPNVLTQFPLATSSGAAIVTPNVDTVYGAAPVDLSQVDVEITIPAVPDGRFYNLGFYDLYGNNFANLGSVNDAQPGRYLLRQGTDTIGVELCDDVAPYLGYVSYPTVYGLVFPRFEVRNNNTDVATVNGIRDQISFTEMSRETCTTDICNAPPLTTTLLNTTLDYRSLGKLFPGSLNGTAVKELLRLTALLTPYNPPEVRDQGPNISRTLSQAGLDLDTGTYTPPINLNLTLALQLVNDSLVLSGSPPYTDILTNDWEVTDAKTSGNFLTNYITRAYIAYSGWLELTSSVALYPIYRGPLLARQGGNIFSIAANESLLFTFSRRPPVNGFWSLTAYDAAHHLVSNPFNIYSVGDRSNLTYPDGTLVYTKSPPPSSLTSGRETDGSFQILMQAADIAPPANWSNNWLPSPAHAGLFTINLRYYWPSDALRNGSYIQPMVTRQAAITSG